MGIRRGIYVNKGAGLILSVQVYYGPTASSPMDIETYRTKGIFPPAETLPEASTYHQLRDSIRHRKMTLLDCSDLIGHVVRVSIGGVIYDGILLGHDRDGAVAATIEGPVQLWELLAGNGDSISFDPLNKSVKVELP